MAFDISPELHLEITSKCALACPACPRTYRAGEYAVTELPLSALESIAQSSVSFESINLCGDHGDPIYHSKFHEAIPILRQVPGNPRLIISTNGSHRNEDWWRKTASLMTARDEFVFGIDGLENTSHLYRRNSDWKTIIRGIEILKELSHCHVRWQWILFNFNEGQMEEAAQLAKRLKIDTFMVVGSSRHNVTDQWRPSISIDEAQARFRRAYVSAL